MRQLRFIPAGAGNSSRSAHRMRVISVHPRGCGEQWLHHALICLSSGSSPRVRGTAEWCRLCRGQIRFIPAGAGNRAKISASVTPRAVHPRGCGEQGEVGHLRSPEGGSSPRVRGTGYAEDKCGLRLRFIPAGAGNRTIDSHTRGIRPVHPRGCGEQARSQVLPCSCGGSSPRVRGTAEAALKKAVKLRFIPAGAGNSRHGGTRGDTTAVHPRGCGEQNGC